MADSTSGESFVTKIRVNDPVERAADSNVTGNNYIQDQNQGDYTLSNGSVIGNAVETKSTTHTDTANQSSPSIVVLPPSPAEMPSRPENHDFRVRDIKKGPPPTDPNHVSKKTFCSFLLGAGLLASLVCLISMAVLYQDARTRKSPTTELKQIKETFNFVNVAETSKLKKSFQTKVLPGVTSQYYLIEKDDILVWGKPSLNALLTWFRGETVKVHLIRANGDYVIFLLGDSVAVKEANYQVAVLASDHIAFELNRGKTHALISAWFGQGNTRNFTLVASGTEDLIKTFPKHEKVIKRLGA